MGSVIKFNAGVGFIFLFLIGYFELPHLIFGWHISCLIQNTGLLGLFPFKGHEWGKSSGKSSWSKWRQRRWLFTQRVWSERHIRQFRRWAERYSWLGRENMYCKRRNTDWRQPGSLLPCGLRHNRAVAGYPRWTWWNTHFPRDWVRTTRYQTFKAFGDYNSTLPLYGQS